MNTNGPAPKRMRNDNRLLLKEELYESIPLEVWEIIFSRLKYEKIAELRLVCRKFNTVCKMMLHKGRLKVEKELAERLELTKNELLKRRRGEHMKYNVLYFIDSSLHKLCHLFREFMGDYVECFTLGKMIDLLNVIFKSLDYVRPIINVDEWFYKAYTARDFWRRLCDIQTKYISDFDYCLVMWLNFGEYRASVCSPTRRLLHPDRLNEKEDQDYIKKTADKQINIERECYIHFGDFEPRNEHWIYNEPPPLNDGYMEMFRKYLL